MPTSAKEPQPFSSTSIRNSQRVTKNSNDQAELRADCDISIALPNRRKIMTLLSERSTHRLNFRLNLLREDEVLEVRAQDSPPQSVVTASQFSKQSARLLQRFVRPHLIFRYVLCVIIDRSEMSEKSDGLWVTIGI